MRYFELFASALRKGKIQQAHLSLPPTDPNKKEAEDCVSLNGDLLDPRGLSRKLFEIREEKVCIIVQLKEKRTRGDPTTKHENHNKRKEGTRTGTKERASERVNESSFASTAFFPAQPQHTTKTSTRK